MWSMCYASSLQASPRERAHMLILRRKRYHLAHYLGWQHVGGARWVIRAPDMTPRYFHASGRSVFRLCSRCRFGVLPPQKKSTIGRSSRTAWRVCQRTNSLCRRDLPRKALLRRCHKWITPMRVRGHLCTGMW